MKVTEVMIKGNNIITVTENSQKIPYGSIGLSRKDCMNQFYGFINQLRKKGLKLWHSKPLARFNEHLEINKHGNIGITGGYQLTATVVINPIITNLNGEPIKPI